MYLTMRIIRHKTLHKSFMIGIPLIVILQIIALSLKSQGVNAKKCKKFYFDVL